MSQPSARFVSRLTKETLAVILAGGRGSRLGDLTMFRAKPAVPFGGKYRIIDFALSNCLNSNIRRIAVLTQYKAHYLIRHLQQGWGHFSAEQGEFVDIIPAQQWVNEESWYQGTADAVFQSMGIIEAYSPAYVLILAGDHVYNMDYGEMLAAHVDAGADFTIACKRVPRESATGFGVMEVDEDFRIVQFEEKPDDPRPMPDDPDSALASMGIYVFSLRYLTDQLRRDAKDDSSSHDFGNDLIPHAIKSGHKVHAYQFSSPGAGAKDYWQDVGTIDAYFAANMELLLPNPPLVLSDPDWPVFTYQQQTPPAEFVSRGMGSQIENALISGGCIVESSSLSNTILFPNSRVEHGCEIDNALILPESRIGRGCRLKNVIIDNGCTVPAGTVIGENPEQDGLRYKVTDGGTVVVARFMLGVESDKLLPPRFRP